MRALLALAMAFLLPGCLAAAVDDEPGPYASEPAGQQQVPLGGFEALAPEPGRHPFTVTVPDGGAVNVQWRMVLSGASLDASVEGPGCGEADTGIAVGQFNSVDGSCDDLAAGEHDFALIVTGALASVQVEVTGWTAA